MYCKTVESKVCISTVLSSLPSHPDIIDAVSITVLRLSLHNIFCNYLLWHGYGSQKIPWDWIFFTLDSAQKQIFSVTTNDDLKRYFWSYVNVKERRIFTAVNILLPFVQSSTTNQKELNIKASGRQCNRFYWSLPALPGLSKWGLPSRAYQHLKIPWVYTTENVRNLKSKNMLVVISRSH